MKRFFQGLAMESIPPECRETYRRHRLFAVCDALAAGILVNTPVMALKGLASRIGNWQFNCPFPVWACFWCSISAESCPGGIPCRLPWCRGWSMA